MGSMQMDLPEYIELFRDKGELDIKVKFKDFDGSVTDLQMATHEIAKLINPVSQQFYTEMAFDGWPFEIYKYQIDPIKKKLTIMVRKIRDYEY